jgi:hypothetical protein
MVYAAIATVIVVDAILVIVVGMFIMGTRARADAHRHH